MYNQAMNSMKFNMRHPSVSLIHYLLQHIKNTSTHILSHKILIGVFVSLLIPQSHFITDAFAGTLWRIFHHIRAGVDRVPAGCLTGLASLGAAVYFKG